MDSAIIFLFVPLVLVAALLSNIGIWSPRRMWLKLSALAAAVMFIPLSYTSLSELMSVERGLSLDALELLLDCLGLELSIRPKRRRKGRRDYGKRSK